MYVCKEKTTGQDYPVYIVTWECSSLFAMSLRISLCIHVGGVYVCIIQIIVYYS